MTRPNRISSFEGRLLGIYLARCKCSPLQRVEEVQAVPGRGLAGDRYFFTEGTFSRPAGPDREVTLIEMEALEALGRDCRITLEPGQARRNLVTCGVPLNHLVGQDFSIGAVLLHGIRLCEPCAHLEALTVPGIQEGLCHRGGLRAQIISGGILRAGAAIRPHPPSRTAD